MVNIGYFRLSKEDLDKDLTPQINAVKEKFSISKFDYLLCEQGTAFHIENVKNRSGFLQLLRFAFDSEKVTIQDIYLNNFKKKELNIYVWDYNRIMRIFEYNILFLLLCDVFNVKIYSFRQGLIERKLDEKPAEKFARYMLCSISAFSSEDYSQNISDNTKKAVVRIDANTNKKLNATKSSYGNVWGKGFKKVNGSKLNSADSEKLIKSVKRLINKYETTGFKAYYNVLIIQIIKKYGVDLSKSFISKVKKSM